METMAGLQALNQSLQNLGNSFTQQQQLGFGQKQAMLEAGLRQRAQEQQEREFESMMDFRNKMLGLYGKAMGAKQAYDPADMLLRQNFLTRFQEAQTDPKYLKNGQFDMERAWNDTMSLFPGQQDRLSRILGNEYPQTPTAPTSQGGGFLDFIHNHPIGTGLGTTALGAGIGTMFGGFPIGTGIGAGIGGVVGGGMDAMSDYNAANPTAAPLIPPDQSSSDFPIFMPQGPGTFLAPGDNAKRNAIAPNSNASTRRINRNLNLTSALNP